MRTREEVIATGFLGIESLKVVYHTFRPRISEGVKALDPMPAHMRVAISLTGRAQRLAETIEAIARAGFAEESFGFLRPLVETFSNLYFILYAGPGSDRGDRDPLAERFLAYADVQLHRFVKKLSPEVRRELANRNGMDEAALKKRLREIDKAAEKAQSRFDFAGHDWHPTNGEDRLSLVEKHLPDWMRSPYWTGPRFSEYVPLMKASLTQFHSALHGDQFHLSQFWQDSPAGPVFVDQRSVTARWSDCAAFMALWCWLALAGEVGLRDRLMDLFKQEINDRGNALQGA